MKYPGILIMALLALTVSADADGQYISEDTGTEMAGMKFTISDPAGRNSITFKSTAPLEDIVGTSQEITGFVIFDPANPMMGGQGEFKVPVASLETGIPLRDEHLRGEGWLNAEKYPHVVFKIRGAREIKEVKSSSESSTYDALLIGEFSFHGVTRSVEIPGRFTFLKESEKTRQRLSGDLLAGRANFDIVLKDYDVTGPPGMGLIGSKVGEVISVDVSFMGTNRATMADDTGSSEEE